MKKHCTLIAFCCLVLLGFVTGCGRKPAPVKEGVISKVTWSPSPNTQTGLYREKRPATPIMGQGGEYNVDMRGKLYQNCLVVERVGNQDSQCQVIPLNQIIWLEFGNGGITVVKP